MRIEFLDSQPPSNVAVSAARTCYFPNGLVTPKESESWKRKPQLLEAIFKGGHHTTLQHTHITLLIDGISRHFIWRLLHSHSFYNSEQVSQRYAKMKKDSFVYPKNCNKEKWENYYQQTFENYEELIEILLPSVEEVIPKFRKKDSMKKAQEMARYVLPVGISAYLYHTVNIITLLRYIAVAKSLPEVQNEAKEFADIISTKLIELDPLLKPLIEYAKKSEFIFPNFDITSVKEKHQIDNQDVFVYDVSGDFDVPLNGNYADVLRSSQMVFDNSILGGFTTYMQLSLSADAQNQRHRRSLSFRPSLKSIYKQNYYTPPIIEKNQKAKELYDKTMRLSYSFFEEQENKLSFGEAIYALNNAHKIEILERNDFSSFNHKAQMRLCYNAQEEIFDITYKQVEKLREKNIKGIDNFMPPCVLRQKLNIRPTCPEGDHFCGIKVWKLKFEDFKREI